MTQIPYEIVFPLIGGIGFLFMFYLGYLFTKFFAKTRPKKYNILWLVLLIYSILILGLLFPMTKIISQFAYALVYAPFLMLVFTIYFLYKFMKSVER
ncbi:MAG: hypothetical protein GOU97_00590 [Nanoarchaeota archaeon]|nr:hypothetical protein [Nanoarchaeota archaeon]